MKRSGAWRPGGRSGIQLMVQAWLSSGIIGKEKPEEDQGHKEDKIVKGLVDK